MSVDEDTELRDMVMEQLDGNGVLGKIKAMLRANVFLALENPDAIKKSDADSNLRRSLMTNEGKIMAALVLEYLHFFNLEFTVMTYKPEACLDDNACLERDELTRRLDIIDSEQISGQPVLAEVVRRGSSAISGSGDERLHGRKSTDHGDLTQKHIAEAKKKFLQYDKDNSGSIDKDELRMLFSDMFPDVNKNMLDRYVTDEYRSADRDFSGGIDFDEFLNLYRSFFVLSKSVVSHDVGDMILTSPKQLPSLSKIPVKMPDGKKAGDRPNETTKQPESGGSSKSQSAVESSADAVKMADRPSEISKITPPALETSGENKENIYIEDRSNGDKTRLPLGRTAGGSQTLPLLAATSGQVTFLPAAADGSCQSPTSGSHLWPMSSVASQSMTSSTAAHLAAPVVESNTELSTSSTQRVPASSHGISAMSSLADLPLVTRGQKPVSSTAVDGALSKADDIAASDRRDSAKDAKAIDKRLAELGFDDEDYEEDFQSSANPSESVATTEKEDEIEEEIVDDIDDILNTGRSVDNATTDRTVTPVHDMDSADYWEEAELIK